MIHQIDSKHEWLLFSAGFTAKFELAFVKHWKTLFLDVFLKPTERAQVLLKSGTRDFQSSLPFDMRDRHVFM